ncbi:MAG: hypothetical protein JWL81_2682, partial [Verrucomicrobiales bacterium]|nr:hypothetical protein [Verrucomicrobiales bacterium]
GMESAPTTLQPAAASWRAHSKATGARQPVINTVPFCIP